MAHGRSPGGSRIRAAGQSRWSQQDAKSCASRAGRLCSLPALVSGAAVRRKKQQVDWCSPAQGCVAGRHGPGRGGTCSCRVATVLPAQTHAPAALVHTLQNLLEAGIVLAGVSRQEGIQRHGRCHRHRRHRVAAAAAPRPGPRPRAWPRRHPRRQAWDVGCVPGQGARCCAARGEEGRPCRRGPCHGPLASGRGGPALGNQQLGLPNLRRVAAADGLQ